MNDLAEITQSALNALRARAEELASDAGSELLDTLKRAGGNLQGLLELAIEGEVSTGEVLAATDEIKETIEGAIAGEVFDTQRDVLKLLKNTVVEYLPLIAKAVL